MKFLSVADYVAIAVYLLVLLGLGFYLSRRASASLEDYFLAGRRLPWWALGISGMASNLDMTGTILIVSFLFMLGPRGLYIEFRGGAVLILAVLLLWTGKWNRRSNCMTGAEWMEYRFGSGIGGQVARVVTACAVMFSMVASLAYMTKGVGLGLSMFLPYSPMTCAVIMLGAATVYTAVSGFYGVVYTDLFQSVIVFAAVIVVTTLAVMALAGHHADLPALAYEVTGNSQWTSALPHWHTTMPGGKEYRPYSYLAMFACFYLMRNVLVAMGMGQDPKYYGARNERECGTLTFLWTFLLMFRWPMMMGFAVLGLFLVREQFPDRQLLRTAERQIKQHLVERSLPDTTIDWRERDAIETIVPPGTSFADIPTLLAFPRADAEAARQFQDALGPGWEAALRRAGEQQALIDRLVPRAQWNEEVASIINRPDAHREIAGSMKSLFGEHWQTKLKLLSYDGGINPERILPAVILFDIPMGFRGLLLIALLAASMSTFDSGVNASAAYFTRDLYQRYWRPEARNRELMVATYVYILLVVAGGFAMAYTSTSINDIWGWLIMGLGGGMLVPGLLKFYWWRFNAAGVIVGTVVGMTGALVQRLAHPDLDERLQFLILMLVGLIGSIVGTFLSKPNDPKVLEHFYRTTRPFGFWGPLKESLDPHTRRRMVREHRNDLIALPFTLGWQITLFLLPMELIIGNFRAAAYTSVIFVVCLAGMYVFWYRNLPPAVECGGSVVSSSNGRDAAFPCSAERNR